MNKKEAQIKNTDIKLLWELTKDAFDVFEVKQDKKFDAVNEKIESLETNTQEIFGKVTHDIKNLSGKVDTMQENMETLNKKVDIIGSLMANTHQEVKNFTKLHEVLDTRVARLERRMERLEALMKAS